MLEGTSRKAGSADLTLRIPRAHVQEAIARLSALGTITGEQVDVQDLQAGVNATDRTIARLQRSSPRCAREPPDPGEHRAHRRARRVRSKRLQRGEAADDPRRALRDRSHCTSATGSRRCPESHGHGPLHGLGVAFRWLGIGAVYALALGAPLVLLLWLAWLAVRTLRRRREDALLSRS